MMIYINVVLFMATVAAAGSSYQYVRFINKPQQAIEPNRQFQKESDNARSPRSYHFPIEYDDFEDIWPESLFLHKEHNFLDVTLGTHGPQYTPDFSNGLDYPDPYLLKGYAAVRAVAHLYGKGELFFHNIPHGRAVAKLQQLRKENGLPPNRLGSLNYMSPFYRDRAAYYSNF